MTAEDIAFAGVVVAGVSAVASSVAPLAQGILTRRHEARMARAERLYRDLRGAYSALLESLYRIQMVVDQAQSDSSIDPALEMRKLVDDTTYQLTCQQAFAAVRSIASDPIDVAIDAVDRASTHFMLLCRQEPFDSVERDAAYKAYLDELSKLERLMRRELRTL